MDEDTGFIQGLSVPEPFAFIILRLSNSLEQQNGVNRQPGIVALRTFAGLIIIVRARQNPMRAPPKKITIIFQSER
jgi:hypothetical protein